MVSRLPCALFNQGLPHHFNPFIGVGFGWKKSQLTLVFPDKPAFSSQVCNHGLSHCGAWLTGELAGDGPEGFSGPYVVPEHLGQRPPHQRLDASSRYHVQDWQMEVRQGLRRWDVSWFGHAVR